MRIIAVILSFYLLFLNTISCDDVEFDLLDSDSVVSLITAQEDDHTHNQEDDCSPFCICNCCHTACFIVYPPQITAELFSYQNFNFYYPEKYLSQDSNNLFRPPKA